MLNNLLNTIRNYCCVVKPISIVFWSFRCAVTQSKHCVKQYIMLQAFKSWHIPFVSESREVILEAKVKKKKNIEFNAQLLFQKKLKFTFQNF